MRQAIIAWPCPCDLISLRRVTWQQTTTFGQSSRLTTTASPRNWGWNWHRLAAQTASQYGGQGGAVVFGPREAAETVGQYGLSTVYYCDDPAYKSDIVGPASAVISSLIEQHTPRLVLLPSTPLGKDWAGRLCGKLGLGIEADVIELSVEGGKATNH